MHRVGNNENLIEDWVFLSRDTSGIDAKVEYMVKAFAKKGSILKTLIFVNTEGKSLSSHTNVRTL